MKSITWNLNPSTLDKLADGYLFLCTAIGGALLGRSAVIAAGMAGWV